MTIPHSSAVWLLRVCWGFMVSPLFSSFFSAVIKKGSSAGRKLAYGIPLQEFYCTTEDWIFSYVSILKKLGLFFLWIWYIKNSSWSCLGRKSVIQRTRSQNLWCKNRNTLLFFNEMIHQNKIQFWLHTLYP